MPMVVQTDLSEELRTIEAQISDIDADIAYLRFQRQELVAKRNALVEELAVANSRFRGNHSRGGSRAHRHR